MDSARGNPGLNRPPSSAGYSSVQRPPSASSFKEPGMNSMRVDDDEEEGETGQLQFIVKKTNEVLGTNYSLVSFDAKKGRDLLQVLNDIFASLDPKLQADVTREDPAVTMQRMGEFLMATLNYKAPPNKQQELQAALTTGETTLLYPIMYWVLKRMPENHKRVYLAKYLIPLNIPEDMCASDDGVREVFNQYKVLVEQFKEVHKSVDRLKTTSNAQGTKSVLGQFEQEKEQLQVRVEVTKKKFAKANGTEPLFKASQKLRQEIENERELEDRMNEQLALRKTSDQRIQQANQRLLDIKRDFSDMNIDKMIRALQDEVAMNSVLSNDKLPKQVAEYRDKVDSVLKALSEPLDPDMLNQQVYQLENEIAEIENHARPKMSNQDESTLGLFRQQAALVANRKEKFAEELQGLKEAKAKVEEELATRDQEFRGFQGSKILKGEEFKAYANSLRGKSTQYKRLKTELQDIKAELGILQHTEEILNTKHQVLNSSMAQMEEQKGIKGYRDVKDNLVAISEGKMEIDEAKGKTLEELSKVVQEFVANIRDRRNKLAPQILELRNTRQKSQTVEQEYQQKKEIYDSNQQELEEHISKLQQEYDQCDEDCHTNESLYHRLNCQIMISEVNEKRASDEKEFKSGARKLSEQHKTWSEMLERELGQLDQISRQLRERKKDIEENHEAHLQQMKWFKDLHKLLECKIAFYKREASGHGQSTLAGVDMNPLAGVDRLVMGP
jgi:intraflagellar transport protein 81|mmetsp:Transcript_49153/g.82401  ORF Transcript_49153/g.82401 Transcript_49153/m.82401 type:complete len:728 (-) Transcript_49153:1310-3493(-)